MVVVAVVSCCVACATDGAVCGELRGPVRDGRSLVVVVSERWSLSALRRAVLPLPLWEGGPPCAVSAFDVLCELSWSQDSGLCAAESAVGVCAAVAVSGGGWQDSAAAAAVDAVAAAIAWVAEAGTASVLEQAAVAV